ncbi:hypothetical protein ACHQM5_000694 [Ranunculus cassubicifolius]
MDGREAMSITGPGSYYMQQRGVPGSGTGTQQQQQQQQPGLHIPSPGFRPMPNQSVGTGSIGTSFPIESSLANTLSVNVTGNTSGEPVKRKRGRPRKYGPDGGGMSLALSPMASPPPGPSSLSPSQKRGRGRPPGTGRKQQLASLGEWISGSAGMGFTPHVLTIAVGEDIATKVMSFSQQGPRAVCILSANGAVSTVTLCQPSTSGGTVTYEGRFEILCLSGSYMLADGSRGRTGGLTISLSSPDGRVIGGGVGGVLIAATPIQVVVGSFLCGGSKTKNKEGTAANNTESAQEADQQASEHTATPTSLPITQTHTQTSTMMSSWPAPRPIDMRNTVQLDIDLTRG